MQIKAMKHRSNTEPPRFRNNFALELIPWPSFSGNRTSETSLPGSLRLSQHHSRLPSCFFVISYEALRFFSFVRCQIVRPPKPDRLKPKFRLHDERSSCVPGRDHIPHGTSAVREPRIVG